MDNIDNALPTGENLDTGTNPVVTPEGQPLVVDIDKTDNLVQLREHAKGLDKDLKSYKPVYEKVNSLFGDDRTLEVAHSMFSGFAGEQFDPDAFYKTLEQLSPNRSKQLFEKFATSQASELAQKEVEKMLGGKASPDEIRLFKQWKENGYGLGEGEDIPEALKFNSDGTPKSDEEIAFLRNLNKTVQESKTEKVREADLKAQAETEARQEAEAQAINDFAQGRLEILTPELATLGLDEQPTDTAEQRQEKNFIKQFIINGVSAMFMQSKHSQDYASAVAHIKQGEVLLARPYEARIEKGLLDIMRSKEVGRLLSALTKEESTPEVRPEISTTGTSPTGNEKPNKRVTGDDIFKNLVAEGKIKI